MKRRPKPHARRPRRPSAAQTAEPPEPLPRHSGIRFVLGIGVAAILLAMGRMMSSASADTLIPVLASLYRWTWFYWGQNRLGLPIALVAGVFHNPLHNLIVQTALSSFFALASFALVGVFVAGRYRATVVGLAAAALFVAAAPAGFHQEFLTLGPSYGIGLTSAMLGLLVLEQWTTVRPAWRWLGAGLLLFFAFWANLAVVFFVGPLAGLRSLWGPEDAPADDESPRRWHRWQWLAVLVPTFAANFWIALSYRYQDDLSLAPLADVPEGLLRLSHNTLAAFDVSLALVVAALTAAGITTAVLRRAHFRTLLRGSLAVLAGVLGYLTITVTSSHVWRNGLAFRYAIPAVVAILATLVALALVSWLPLARKKYVALEWALMASLLVATVVRHGMPSPAVVRTIIDDKFGKRTAQFLASGCPILMGDYWEVWPTVFHTNLTLYESGHKRVVWGLAHRAEVTMDLWGPLVGKTCMAVPATPISKSTASVLAQWFKIPSLVEIPQRPPLDQIVVVRAQP